MIRWDEIAHFRPDEFSHPELLRTTMAYLLDDLRGQFGAALVVSSSYRDPEHNAAVGGAAGSAHTPAPDGKYSGVDLTTPRNALTGAERYRLLTIALSLGFKRIGLYEKHIHLDIEDARLASPVIWLGKI